jgi:hypothetical protein
MAAQNSWPLGVEREPGQVLASRAAAHDLASLVYEVGYARAQPADLRWNAGPVQPHEVHSHQLVGGVG